MYCWKTRLVDYFIYILQVSLNCFGIRNTWEILLFPFTVLHIDKKFEKHDQYQGVSVRQIAYERVKLIKVDLSSKKLIFVIFPFSSFTIDFKICLYARHFDTSRCPHILKLILKELKEEKAIFFLFKT